MTYTEAKRIMGRNFVGPEELSMVKKAMRLHIPDTVPEVPYNAGFLKKISRDYILILGVSKTKDGKPLTVNLMREILGTNPDRHEPCFYNQDWYLRERFAAATALEDKWYLIRKTVIARSKGVHPDILSRKSKAGEGFPSAVLAAFAFFTHYLASKEKLWKHSFVWCSDKDRNGDRIYVGRYEDPKHISGRGFNIHRHLTIGPAYGLAPQLK